MQSRCAFAMLLHYFFNTRGLRARGYFSKRIFILCMNRSEESVPYERVETVILRSKFVVHIVTDGGIDPSPDGMGGEAFRVQFKPQVSVSVDKGHRKHPYCQRTERVRDSESHNREDQKFCQRFQGMKSEGCKRRGIMRKMMHFVNNRIELFAMHCTVHEIKIQIVQSNHQNNGTNPIDPTPKWTTHRIYRTIHFCQRAHLRQIEQGYNRCENKKRHQRIPRFSKIIGSRGKFLLNFTRDIVITTNQIPPHKERTGNRSIAHQKER